MDGGNRPGYYLFYIARAFWKQRERNCYGGRLMCPAFERLMDHCSSERSYLSDNEFTHDVLCGNV